MNELRQLQETYEKARTHGRKCALAVVIRVEGSAYRRTGAKMLITEDGEISGAVSGGCLERDLIHRALKTMVSGIRERVVYDTRLDRPEENEDEAVGIVQAGLGCEGIIEILIEPAPESWFETYRETRNDRRSRTHPFRLNASGEVFYDPVHAPIELVIFGAGHDAVAMSRLASELGWETCIVDSRSSFPQPLRHFQHVDRFVRAPAERAVAESGATKESAVIVMTHHFDHDVEILAALLPLRSRYLGLLGPRVRAEKILKPDDRPWVHYPLGLDLGGDGPQAIALAALAEIQAVLHHKTASPLRDLSGTIHERKQK